MENEKNVQVFIMDGLKVIGETKVSGETRIKLLDNNYSLLYFKGVTYSFLQVQWFEEKLFVFVASFPHPQLTL